MTNYSKSNRNTVEAFISEYYEAHFATLDVPDDVQRLAAASRQWRQGPRARIWLECEWASEETISALEERHI